MSKMIIACGCSFVGPMDASLAEAVSVREALSWLKLPLLTKSRWRQIHVLLIKPYVSNSLFQHILVLSFKIAKFCFKPCLSVVWYL